MRLENSIKSLISEKKLIINLHYPPINADGTLNDFFKLAKEYKAHTVIYGHLHGNGHRLIKEGKFEGGKTIELGLADEGAVGIAPTSDKHVKKEILDKIPELTKKIISGDIKVPYNEETYKEYQN